MTCNVNPIIVHAISGECDAQVTVPAPTAEDPCNEIFSITHDSPYGVDEFDASGRYPVGIHTVTWTATDRSLNSAVICVQKITVIDDQELAITCPDDVTQLADNGELFATGINYPDEIGDPTLTENCHNPKLTWIMTPPVDNSVDPPVDYASEYLPEELEGEGIFTGTGKYWLGVTTITYTYADEVGNSVNCSFTVTIEAKPEIECPSYPGILCR